MGRLVHFEIHVSDMDRAKDFMGKFLMVISGLE